MNGSVETECSHAKLTKRVIEIVNHAEHHARKDFRIMLGAGHSTPDQGTDFPSKMFNNGDIAKREYDCRHIRKPDKERTRHNRVEKSNRFASLISAAQAKAIRITLSQKTRQTSSQTRLNQSTKTAPNVIGAKT